jgi:hypothetical protein
MIPLTDMKHERFFPLAALIAAVMMLAAAARGGSTVNVNPGTITQASLDAAGVNGTIRFVAAGQYQCAAQLKPLAGQSFRRHRQDRRGAVSRHDYRPGLFDPELQAAVFGTGDRRAGRLLRLQDQRGQRQLLKRRLPR